MRKMMNLISECEECDASSSFIFRLCEFICVLACTCVRQGEKLRRKDVSCLFGFHTALSFPPPVCTFLRQAHDVRLAECVCVCVCLRVCVFAHSRSGETDHCHDG